MQDSDFSLDDLSDCSSGSIEVCCDDLAIGLILSLSSPFMATHIEERERSKNPLDVKMEGYVVMGVDNGRNWAASQLGCQRQLYIHPF